VCVCVRTLRTQVDPGFGKGIRHGGDGSPSVGCPETKLR